MRLTKRQKEILEFLRMFIGEHDYAPSYEEIAEHFGFSSLATVHKHLTHLETKGVISKAWNQKRAIELAREQQPVEAVRGVELPMLGFVAAGRPIEAVEQGETVSVPADFVGGKAAYVLRVEGNSMIDEQIRDGDFVVVESRSTAENGETVVALVRNEEVTLKKFYHERGTVRLQPANPDVAPLLLSEEDVAVQGVVVGVLRKFR